VPALNVQKENNILVEKMFLIWGSPTSTSYSGFLESVPTYTQGDTM
jgi:hypothetical protein